MRKGLKVTFGITGSIIVLIAAAIFISYLMLRKSLPDYEGEVNVKGISDNIKIYRDDYGVPFVYAESEDDAIFALGYLHAQERLFQMDLARRAGEGRLSEIFGSKTVPFDKMFRTVGMYKHVVDDYEKLSPVSKEILIAYSDGVNEFINSHQGNFPIEFDVLGYEPYHWKPEHSLVIAKMMAWELNISWWTDIAFANLVQKFGENKVREILPDYPENAPTIIPSETKSLTSVSDNLIKTDREFRKFMGFVGTHIGSNNWVVNGERSSSGKPIIANDPHLAYQAPGKWYMAVLRSPGLKVEGFTLPGLPAVVIGKNQNISWAVTNVMADDADFYTEKIDTLENKYLYNGEWKPLETRLDTIRIKDSAEVEFSISVTNHGPIISDVHAYNVIYPGSPEILTLSMQWTGLDFSDELFAINSVNKAKNWNEFKSALKYFTVPGQNFVYADKEGNIGYVCAAKLPIRRNASPSIIFDGTTDKYDWKGFVPYEEMPKLFNPQTGIIASANNKTVNDFKYHISNIWEPSSRIDRIYELLNSKQKHSVKDFEKYQMDFESKYAEKLTAYLLDAFKDVKVMDENLNSALELLKHWDYKMDKLSQVPTIYTRFLQFLIKDIFEDEMGEDLLKEYVFIANVPYRVTLEMLSKNNSSWFDDITTEKIENRDAIIRKSMADAITDLENKFGKNMAYWQWGDIHKVKFKHFFSGASSLLDHIIDIGPYEIGGDGTTIFNTEYSFPNLYNTETDFSKPYRTKPYVNNLGPSMRYIFNFGKPNQFEYILTTGQSGNILSAHYKDMTEKWLEGKYITLQLDSAAVVNSNYDLLTLTPQ